jgi:hypothetical protein
MSSIGGINTSSPVSIGQPGVQQTQTQQSVMSNAMEAGLLNQMTQVDDMSQMLAMLAELSSKMKAQSGGDNALKLKAELDSKAALVQEQKAKLEATTQKMQGQAKLEAATGMVQATMSTVFGIFGAMAKGPPPPPPPNTFVGIMAKAQQQLAMPKGIPNPLEALLKAQQGLLLPMPPQVKPAQNNPLDSLLKGQLPQNMLGALGMNKAPPTPPPPPKSDAQLMQDMQGMMNELIKKTQSQMGTMNSVMDAMTNQMNSMNSLMMKSKGGF